MSEARDNRVFAAVDELRSFMDDHLVASKIELEAKLIETHYYAPPFEPAHLHNAAQYLIRAGELIKVSAVTRGGRRPPLFIVADQTSRSRRVEDEAARKRLLMSRYYSYVEGGKEAGSSLAGPAGEMAFHSAFLRTSVGASLATVTRGRPSVPVLFGRPVPMGPLDNAFVLQPLDPQTNMAVGPWGVHALVEVKNIREWIYPRTQELYQVLYKAAVVQREDPHANVLPIVVCRRLHKTTVFMAKDLGFFAIDARRQYLPVSSLIDRSLLAELTTELGITDLVQGDDATHTARTEIALRTLQQRFDVQTAIDRWRYFSADRDIFDAISRLVDARLPNVDRDEILGTLRGRAHELGASLSW